MGVLRAGNGADPRIVGLYRTFAMGSRDLPEELEQVPAPSRLCLGGGGNPDRARMRFHLSPSRWLLI